MIPRPSSSSKRKKWTEEEERSLIEKYASMSADGSLSRLRTRERRFRPIADHVNAAHHAADPAAFPFLWSWKDASTKVQNMRHQYLLVKQKLLSSTSSAAAASDRPGSDGLDLAADLDWAHQAVSLWPNFLRYRDVFGDHALPPKPQDGPDDGDGDLGLGLGFDADEDGFAYAATSAADAADVVPAPPKKRKKKRSATEEEEDEEEWEERMEKRREEWRKKVEEMLRHHRAEMEGIQERILQDQQSMVSQVLGLVSNWAAPLVVGGIPDGAAAASLGNPNNNSNSHHHHHQNHHNHQQYLSQMMQGLHQENEIAAEEGRTGAGEAPEDQFIVD